MDFDCPQKPKSYSLTATREQYQSSEDEESELSDPKTEEPSDDSDSSDGNPFHYHTVYSNGLWDVYLVTAKPGWDLSEFEFAGVRG